MAMNEFSVEITTPQKKWVYENVTSCTAPGTQGNFQVLYNHAPLLSKLEIGEIHIETSDGKLFYATSGGFIEVLNNRVSYLLETCENAEKIDVERAEQAAERAKKRLHEQTDSVDTARANASLVRALNRIRIAKKTRQTNQ